MSSELQILLWVQALMRSFGRARPAVNPDALRKLHANGDFDAMVALMKADFALKMRLRIGRVNSYGPENCPSWIEMPKEMPMYGTEAFRKTLVTMYIQKSFLKEAPCGSIVVAVAHELSHVVLNSTQHELRHKEPAVDLTAMLLGYLDFFLEDSFYTTCETNPIYEITTTKHIGYLTHEERGYAANLMCR
jgi:hypothetical protein